MKEYPLVWPLTPSAESTEDCTGPRIAGPRTVAWVRVMDWPGSISTTGLAAPFRIVPLPVMMPVAMLPLAVWGPLIRRPP